jgi:hypothetical protein
MSTPNSNKFLQNLHQGIFPLIYASTNRISDAKYYAKVFEKVKTDPKYPMNEKHRLEAVVAKGNIASEKYTPSQRNF